MPGQHDHETLMLELVRFSRLAYERHLVGASGGNLSVRPGHEDIIFITASGISLRDTDPCNILAIDQQGNVLHGPSHLRPSKETGLHLAVYNTLPSINAVIHVHPVHATAYACCGMNIPLVTISAALKLKQGEMIQEAPPGSPELVKNVGKAIQGSPQNINVLNLERHGLLSFGLSLSDAFDSAELAEDTAFIAFTQNHLESLRQTRLQR